MKKIIYIFFISLLTINLSAETNMKGKEYFDLGNKKIREKNIVEAIRNYTLSCDNDYAISCYYLGTFYSGGFIESKDDKKSHDFYKKGCDLNNNEACTALSLLYFKVGDDNSAFKYSAKSCELGSVIGCETMAEQATKLNDIKNILKYYKKACDLGSDIGCNGMGLIYAQGRYGIKKNIDKGLFYLDESCKKGFKKSCNDKVNLELSSKVSKKQINTLNEALKDIISK